MGEYLSDVKMYRCAILHIISVSSFLLIVIIGRNFVGVGGGEVSLIPHRSLSVKFGFRWCN